MGIRKKPFVFIGITGAFGSGCTSVADYIVRQYRFHKISLSEIVRTFATSVRRKLSFRLPRNVSDLSRLQMQEIGNKLRESNPAFLIDKALQKCGALYGKRNGFVIETIRNPAEINALFSLPYSYVVAVFAPLRKRMVRTRCNSSHSKELFEKADRNDRGEGQPTYGQNVPACVGISDFFIDNSSKKKDLYQQVKKFMGLAYYGRHEKPDVHEVMMSHAFALRLLSPCLQHQVGCVITKDDHLIGSGWNGPPRQTPACKECLREIASRCPECGGVAEIVHSYCPSCGTVIEAAKSLGKHLDLCLAVHAEERAILQAARQGSVSLQGSVLYTTTFPCLMCAKKICEVGASRVVYVEPYPSPKAEDLLKENRVEVERFTGFAARQLYATYYHHKEVEYGRTKRK